jgi:dipeptidyl aminopeptidase/acylaminoacyl peptidase
MTAPHGAWPSPLTAEDAALAGGEPRWLLEQWVTAVDDDVWFAELRPTEGGRAAVVRWRDGDGLRDMFGAEWNARSRVHEMGARPFAVADDGSRFVFANWTDQRLYLVESGAEPVPLTHEPTTPAGIRYGDPVFVGDEVWCVRETLTGPRPTDLHRQLVAIPLSGAAVARPDLVRVLAQTHRFLTGPKVSPDGRHVAWIGWNHPAMPWDGTELCVAEVGATAGHRVLAGGLRESVCQVWWTGDDELTVLTDPDGWWNPYRVTLDGLRTPLWTTEQEIGGALWKPGLSWGAPLADGRLAMAVLGWHERDGVEVHGCRLLVLDPETKEVTEIESAATVWTGLSASGSTLAGMAAGPDTQPAVVRVDVDSGEIRALTPPRYSQPAPEWLAKPVHRKVTVADGSEVHAILHLPRNPDVSAPAGELPPLLVTVHGGPTGRSIDALDPEITFFTSRGIAVVAVNHGGSTGYGRAYRERLRGQWGVVDVADCAAVAAALADDGLIDRDRLLIRGGSAGGWTTASSLTSGAGYRGGVAYYPVLDLLGWATGETHDLESRYLDGLVGPLPESRQTYVRRSPVNRADQLSAPLLLLEGEEDVICPPAPCERMIAAIAGRGVPHAYLTFPGEQHVFRRAESIRRALEAELSFFGQVLGFDPPDIPRVELST